MRRALKEVEKGGSIRSVGREYHIPESSLRTRMQKKGWESLPLGRRPNLQREAEEELADCIRDLCQHGFSLQQEDVLNLVQEYIRANNIPSRFANDRPGAVWLKNFIQRNNLSLKKATLLSQSRRTATENPFIINNWYDILEDVIKKIIFSLYKSGMQTKQDFRWTLLVAK